jgi:hypothetical protein
MHLYNCIWVVLLNSRLNLAFLSPKLSHGIDKMLVYLCPSGFDNHRNTLRWKLLQLAFVRLWIILFGLRTANNTVGSLSTLTPLPVIYSWSSTLPYKMSDVDPLPNGSRSMRSIDRWTAPLWTWSTSSWTFSKFWNLAFLQKDPSTLF